MKNRIIITINEQLVREAKRYASSKNISLSQLIEGYLRQLTSSRPNKKNILELLSELSNPKRETKKATIERYYQERKGKYGF